MALFSDFLRLLFGIKRVFFLTNSEASLSVFGISVSVSSTQSEPKSSLLGNCPYI